MLSRLEAKPASFSETCDRAVRLLAGKVRPRPVAKTRMGPSSPPDALELGGDPLVGVAAGRLPDLTANAVRRVTGKLDYVERIETDDRAWCPFTHGFGVGQTQIH